MSVDFHIGGSYTVLMLTRADIRIETPRLVLRSMQPSDIDALLLIFTDAKVMASFEGELFTREQMERWLQRNLDHQVEFGYGLFSIMHKAAGLLIGDCGLERMDMEGVQAAELGYDIRSDYWNQGIATEAAAAVRDYAFNVLQLPRLISLIRVGNLASKRVAEKTGMALDAEISLHGIRYWRYAMHPWKELATRR